MTKKSEMTPLEVSLASYKNELKENTNKIAVHFVSQVRELMKSQNLSQADLALSLDMKPPQVSRILRHPANMNLSTIVHISNALNSNIDISISHKSDDASESDVIHIYDKNITPHINWRDSANQINTSNAENDFCLAALR